MNTFLIIMIILAAGLTAFVLVKGIMTMAKGKDITGQQSNKLMSMRVMFQALAIVLVIILLLITRGGNGG